MSKLRSVSAAPLAALVLGLSASSAAQPVGVAPPPPTGVGSAAAQPVRTPASTAAAIGRVKVPAPRKRKPALPALRHVASANRAATREPDPQGFVDAAQVLPFAEGAVYHVYTAPARVTDIALEPGETLSAIAAGDTARWIIGDTTSGAGAAKRSHVLVKPVAADLTTNLVIATDRRIYHLALTSTSRTAMVALSWTYPQSQLIALKYAEAKAAVDTPPPPTSTSGLALEQLRFGYEITGDAPSWRPLRAFDDGQQTYIEFPADLATGVAPPLFVVGAKGAAELVNYRVRGRFYVVDRLLDSAELRFGLKHQDVVRITRVADAGARRRPS